MILFIEDPKDSTQKLLNLINKFSKVAVYKINIQKSVAFLYSNNEISERKCKKTVCYLFIYLFIFGCPTAYGVPRPGMRTELQLPPKLQLQQYWNFNPLCQPGIQSASQCSQDAAKPVVPEQKLKKNQYLLKLYQKKLPRNKPDQGGEVFIH